MSFAQTATASTSPFIQWYTIGNSITTTNTITTIMPTGGYVQANVSNVYPMPPYTPLHEVDASVNLVPGNTYKMPDGSCVVIDVDGNYTVNDKDAKVIYRANRVREFNPFLNASDLLEQYIEELVPLGVRQDQVLHLEIEGFIYWLIHRAAERDGDAPPADVPRLPSNITRIRNHCRYCGRFIFHSYVLADILFCSPEHLSMKLARLGYGR